MDRKLFLLIIFALVLSLLSCLTDKQKFGDFAEAPLYGMVYDYDNQPCPDALIVINGEDGPRTDINGRFVIGSLSRGTHAIQVVRDGYEELTVSFDFLNRNQVLYLKVISYNQLLREIEQALEKKRLGEVEELLARAEAIYSDEPVEMYLKALFFLEVEKVKEAVKILEDIIEEGFREPILYLTLADIFQYQLEDLKKASSYLEEYLKVQKDPQVRKRLEQLRTVN